MKGPVTLYSYQNRYGKRLQRLTVDGGFTCPNRDGAFGTGGCTFCDNDAFHPAYTHGKSITGQLEAGGAFHGKRARKADGYLAYFQPFSNTYADLDTLARRYEEALSFPGICGLVVGTRPAGRAHAGAHRLPQWTELLPGAALLPYDSSSLTAAEMVRPSDCPARALFAAPIT